MICIWFLFGLSERGRPWTSQVPQKFHSFHSWRRFGPDLEEKCEVHLRRLRHVLQSLQDRCTMATGCIYLTMAASMDLRPARGPSDHSFLAFQIVHLMDFFPKFGWFYFVFLTNWALVLESLTLLCSGSQPFGHMVQLRVKDRKHLFLCDTPCPFGTSSSPCRWLW